MFSSKFNDALVNHYRATRTNSFFLTIVFVGIFQISCRTKSFIIDLFTVQVNKLQEIVNWRLSLHPLHAIHIWNFWKMPVQFFESSSIECSLRDYCISFTIVIKLCNASSVLPLPVPNNSVNLFSIILSSNFVLGLLAKEYIPSFI